MQGQASRAVDGQASLTADERHAQDTSWNLADAHARQRMSPEEKTAILDKFPDIFRGAQGLPYSTLAEESVTAFLGSLGQHPETSVKLAAYSSSVGTMIVSRLLRQRGWGVSLTRPTFDNLFALLTAEGVAVQPRDVTAGPIHTHLGEDSPKCIFEVSPNNPTGHIIDADELARLARFCAEKRRLLVLDQSFKGHVKRPALIITPSWSRRAPSTSSSKTPVSSGPLSI